MTATMFTRGKHMWNATLSYEAMLVSASYTPDASDHYVSELVAYEIAPAGYARTGSFSLTASYDDVTGYLYLDAADLTFGTLAALDTAPAYVIIYVDTGSDATSTLVMCEPVTTDMRPDFPTIRVSSRGLVRIR